MVWRVKYSLIILISMSLFGCGVREIPQQKATLARLATSNAPLSTVKSTLGMNFEIRKRGSPEWDRMLQTYRLEKLSKRDKNVVSKMDKASAVGFTSSQTMVTYIFLDEQDRIIDYEVGAQ